MTAVHPLLFRLSKVSHDMLSAFTPFFQLETLGNFIFILILKGILCMFLCIDSAQYAAPLKHVLMLHL